MTKRIRDQTRAGIRASAPPWQPRPRLPGEPEPGKHDVMNTHYVAARDNPPVPQRHNSDQFKSVPSFGYRT